MVKISVIIPLYNCEKYIEKCLDSIFIQNFDGVEIICVNDGSTDNTLEKIKKYKNIEIINKENTGAGDSRNAGLKKASGKYILFLDGDDFLESNSLEKIYTRIEKKQGDVLFFNVNKYFDDVNEKEFFNVVEMYEKTFNEEIFSPKEAKDILFTTTAHPFRLYKKETLDRNNIEFAKLEFAEDQLFFYNVLFNFDRMCILNEAIYNYRIHKKSLTASNKNKFLNIIKSFYLCEEVIEKSKYKKDLLENYLNNRIKAFFYWFEKGVTNNEYKEFKKLLKYLKIKYDKKIFEKNFYKHRMDKVLQYSYFFYKINDKIDTTIKLIKSHLN